MKNLKMWLLLPFFLPIVIVVSIGFKIVEIVKDTFERLYFWTYGEFPE